MALETFTQQEVVQLSLPQRYRLYDILLTVAVMLMTTTPGKFSKTVLISQITNDCL